MAKKVLVFEDDEGIIEVITLVLEEKGYQVKAVSNCPDVIKLVIAFQPALILMDIWMPSISGEHITSQLKRDTQTMNIPIVMLSAHRETQRIAQKCGANGYLTKPFDINMLETIVDRYCQEN